MWERGAMRTTVDILDGTYRLLECRAGAKGGSVKGLVLAAPQNITESSGHRNLGPAVYAYG